EPLIGGLAFACEAMPMRGFSSRFNKRVAAILGWAAIAGCVIYPIPEKPWPGIITVLPVMACGAIILARRESPLFALPVVQRLGEWSYSIYLWHWPIWVFEV